MLQATGIASQQDVYAMEAKGFPQDLPENTYEMIRRGVAINPRAPALSFFLRVEDHRHPETWTYAQLFSRITQTANFFDSLGATKNDVIAYVLPNLPETALCCGVEKPPALSWRSIRFWNQPPLPIC